MDEKGPLTALPSWRREMNSLPGRAACPRGREPAVLAAERSRGRGKWAWTRAVLTLVSLALPDLPAFGEPRTHRHPLFESLLPGVPGTCKHLHAFRVQSETLRGQRSSLASPVR